MTEFTIRDARLEDARQMTEIIAGGRERTYGLTPGSLEHYDLVTTWRGASGTGIVQRYMQRQGEWRNLPGDTPRARVVTSAGSSAVVGVMASRQVPVHGQPGVNLDFLFVDGATEGQGVGRLLMNDFSEHAGDKPQSLEVRADNERARGLYEKFGFVVAGAANGGFSLGSSVEMLKNV